jgi:membrane-associated phospholipid phosphatase
LTLAEAIRAEARRWRAVDAFLVLYMVVTALVILAAGPRVAHGTAYAVGNAFAIGLIVLCRRAQLVSTGRVLRCLFGAFPLALICYMWMEISPMQHILYAGWHDVAVRAFEHSVFGVDVNLWVDRFARPWLTEWLMLGYFSYLPLLPIVMTMLFVKRGERAADTYLLGLAVGYAACFGVFVLWPVAGPGTIMHFPSPLKGSVSLWITDQMARYGQFPGGALPSPHTTAGTVMLYMAYRYHRPTFWTILPFILSFYVGTVYGRFHYLSDTVTGIAVGLGAAWVATAKRRWP